MPTEIKLPVWFNDKYYTVRLFDNEPMSNVYDAMIQSLSIDLSHITPLMQDLYLTDATGNALGMMEPASKFAGSFVKLTGTPRLHNALLYGDGNDPPEPRVLDLDPTMSPLAACAQRLRKQPHEIGIKIFKIVGENREIVRDAQFVAQLSKYAEIHVHNKRAVLIKFGDTVVRFLMFADYAVAFYLPKMAANRNIAGAITLGGVTNDTLVSELDTKTVYTALPV